MLTDAREDYARGFVPFLGQTIYLDSKPLIPRSETEYWVEKVITEIREAKHSTLPIRVLDLFSGSGCIGVAVLAHVPHTIVTFAEKEELHLPTIRKNVLKNKINPDRASIVQTDIWSGVAGLFEYILLNPPYISLKRNTIEAEVLAHEPKEALFADNDGFYYIEKTIEKLREFLAPHGAMWIEHEPFQSAYIKTLSDQHTLKAETYTDQYGVLRYSRISVA